MKFLIAVIFAFSSIVHAENSTVTPNSCWPKSNMTIMATSKSGVSNKTYTKILNDFEKTVKPLVDFEHANLTVNRLWTDPEINADTTRNGTNNWVINAYGGFARYPGMTKSGYMTVMCHELGHQLGKAPRYGRNTDWAATEGQADYWSTLKCMKLMAPLGYNPLAGMKALGNVLASLGMEPVPHLNTPDKSEVSRTEESHPAAQPRLDTYYAGYKCKANGNTDDQDPRVGTCYNYDANKKAVGQGNRPRSWYYPTH